MSGTQIIFLKISLSLFCIYFIVEFLTYVGVKCLLIKAQKIKQGSQGGSAASLCWLAKADCVSLLISDITLIV